ncbi:MAG: putative 2-dehydropantoate 2-reductase [Candidatus Azobacteroides sp.]|nr:putative 2-dehydropantoate 2-reductase [Candidatus Azobacteroides sp.]
MGLRYGVIGTGAIGGYYGGKLAKAGNEVHFLFHSDYEYVKENGLNISSIDGDFKLFPVSAYHDTKEMPVCDVVLVGLKSTNNHLLKELLPPLLHKDTLVILIQNGLGLEEDLHATFPSLYIAGGLAFICSNKTGKGHIHHLDYGSLNLGLYSGPEKLLEEVCKDLRNAGIKANILELATARWKKLVWNIPYNGLTVALNTTTDKLMNHPSSLKLIHDLMLEVIHASHYLGYPIPDSYAEEMLEMTKVMTPYSPSMKLDFENKRPLEIEYIYSFPIKKALKAGFRMSKVEMLEKELEFIQANYL